jgi:hypothetical protein
MGKMKELYMEMLQKEMDNTQLHVPLQEEPTQIDIQCPNCFKKKLVLYTITDIKCETGCGHEFVLVDAQTVRFK